MKHNELVSGKIYRGIDTKDAYTFYVLKDVNNPYLCDSDHFYSSGFNFHSWYEYTEVEEGSDVYQWVMHCFSNRTYIYQHNFKPIRIFNDTYTIF